jgi:multicomponent Na+:H+ antiporter subunit G
MNTWVDIAVQWFSYACFAFGAFFFMAGSVGLLRFPDVYTRLHALTKADNLGLGFIAAGLIVRSGSPAVAAKLVLIWLLVLAAGSTTCYLVAEAARKSGVKPWVKETT